MNGVTLAIIGLRAAALALLVAGDTTSSQRMYLLADLVESGKATDAHMKTVAEKLKAGPLSDADWDDVMKRIEDDYAALQS